MSSNNSSVSDFKSSSEKHPETASILSSSTTSSMSAMLKSKFTSKSKKSKSEQEELTPAQKQAKRRQDRVSYQTLATIASLKDKAAKLIEPPTESAADAYEARKATMFLRAGSM